MMKHIRLFLMLLPCLAHFCATAQVMDSISSKPIIFADNFSKEPLGKFPSQWISNRAGEVVIQKGQAGRWFKMHSQGTYLPKLERELPVNFNIEFDLIHQSPANGNNTTEITIFSKPKDAENDALLPGSKGIKIVLETFITSCLCYDNERPNEQKVAEYRSKVLQANAPVKISIKMENQVLRVLVNGQECLNIAGYFTRDEVFNAVRFYFWGSQAEPLIGNVKIY